MWFVERTCSQDSQLLDHDHPQVILPETSSDEYCNSDIDIELTRFGHDSQKPFLSGSDAMHHT
jgi:hypothetical protein